MDYHEQRRKVAALRRITKYGIIGFSSILTLHCGFLFCGYDLFVIHALACAFALWLGLNLSRVYNLCFIHKMCVVYSCAVLLCIVMRRHGVFVTLRMNIHCCRGIMLFIGIILQACVIWKAIRKN